MLKDSFWLLFIIKRERRNWNKTANMCAERKLEERRSCIVELNFHTVRRQNKLQNHHKFEIFNDWKSMPRASRELVEWSCVCVCIIYFSWYTLTVCFLRLCHMRIAISRQKVDKWSLWKWFDESFKPKW